MGLPDKLPLGVGKCLLRVWAQLLDSEADNAVMECVRSIRRLRRQSGQALVEYSLILALISVVAVAVLGGLGETIRHIFLSIIASLASAGNGF